MHNILCTASYALRSVPCASRPLRSCNSRRRFVSSHVRDVSRGRRGNWAPKACMAANECTTPCDCGARCEGKRKEGRGKERKREERKSLLLFSAPLPIFCPPSVPSPITSAQFNRLLFSSLSLFLCRMSYEKWFKLHYPARHHVRLLTQVRSFPTILLSCFWD